MAQTTKTRTQAQRAETQAKRAGREVRATAREAEGTLEALLRDAGYATIGAGDATVEAIRKASRTLPERVVQTPQRVTGLLTQLTSTLQEGYGGLADRGRQVTGAIRRSGAVRSAGDQAKTARRQAKAAGTSVSRAVEAQAEALEAAAEQVGQRQARTTATSRSVQDASTSATGTGRLEDRTVEELYERATELNIEGRSSMKKDDLVAAIRARS